MKKNLTFLFLILIATTVNGQVTFATKVGYNVANINGDITDNQSRLRIQIGGIINADINEMFSFQPGILLNGKGTTFDWGDDDKDAITLNYLEVPLNGVLNLELGTGKLQIFAGPYLGLCLNGKYKYLSDEDGKTEPLDIGTSDDDDIKPMDLGINIGLGYKFGVFQIQGGYGGSLISISNYEDEDLKNNLIYLNFAYFFEL